MPTYEYKCKDCGHLFEKVQRMSDDLLTDCPECQGSLKRLIGTGAGLIFKGSGFYSTDYRSDGYSRDAAKDKTGGGASGASSGGDSASKTTSPSPPSSGDASA